MLFTKADFQVKMPRRHTKKGFFGQIAAGSHKTSASSIQNEVAEAMQAALKRGSEDFSANKTEEST